MNTLSRRSFLRRAAATGAGAGLATLAAAATTPRTAFAQSPPPATIRYGSFQKSVPFIIAQREGFFAGENLNVQFNLTPGSVALFDSLFAGNLDIVSANVDNVVARYVNEQKPLSLIAGVEKGIDLVLAANTARGIHSIADLRGKPIAVDAPDTGFVYALRYILAQNGLLLERGDYSFQVIGSAFLRYQYLQAGQTPQGAPVYASVINYPFTAQAAAPVEVLARVSDYVAPYQSQVFAARQDYLANQSSVVVAFLRAYIAAGKFVEQPRNRSVVLATLANELGVSTPLAEANLDAALSEGTGLNHKARLSKEGLTNTIELRRQFGAFATPLSDRDIRQLVKGRPGGLYDDRFYKAARHSMGDPDND